LKSSKSKVFKSNQSGLQLRNLNYLMTEQNERDDYMDEQDYEPHHTLGHNFHQYALYTNL
jgi:hypothetical protein